MGFNSSYSGDPGTAEIMTFVGSYYKALYRTSSCRTLQNKLKVMPGRASRAAKIKEAKMEQVCSQDVWNVPPTMGTC